MAVRRWRGPLGARPRRVALFIEFRRTHDLWLQRVERGFAARRISSAQFSVLRNLPREGGVSFSELSQRLIRGHSNLTTLIPRMARRGLVEVSADDGDRRVKVVRRTAAGAALERQVMREHRRDLDRVLEVLTPEEEAAIARILAKIRRRLEEL